ncbi:uncharacterized protein LOC120419476 isoform X2 [Culex pipiens pallens]|nr:uncharacterized protein LOC120419476 isoform X2 [Culex pipiens pallens]
MICGRNFRNYLAHDSISYDLLTNSSRMKVLVNALAMVNIDWKLFCHPEKRDLPEIRNVKEEGISIILGEDCLRRSVIEGDFDCFTNRGVLPLGKFWTAIGPYGGLQSLSTNELVNYNECEKNSDGNISNINFKLYNNIRKDNFETALELTRKDSWSSFFESFRFPVSIWRPMGRLVKFLGRKGDISAVFDLLNHFGSKLEIVLMLVGSQELKTITLTVKPSLLLSSQISTIVRSDSLSDLQNMDFLLSSTEVLSPNVLNLLQEMVCCNNIFAFKFTIENFKFSSHEDAERILISCVVSGRIKMVEVFTEKYANNSFNLDRALQMAASHNRGTLVKYLQLKGANLVQIDEFRKIGVTDFGCLKYVAQFPIVLPEGYHLHVELPNVGKFSLADMELLLKSGYNIMRSHQFFRYVLKLEDERILSLVENKIFDFKAVTLCDENMIEWLRVVRECKVLNYLTANLLIHCMKNKPDLFGRILDRIKIFGTTDEGYGVEIVNQFGNAELDTSALDLCTDVEKCLENSEDVYFEREFERELVCIDSHENIEMVKVLYIIYDIQELPKISQNEQIAFYNEHLTFYQIYQNILQILNDLEVLENATIVTVRFEYSNIFYRVLKISSKTVILRCLGRMFPIQEMINTKDPIGRTILFDVKTYKNFKLLIECGADLSVVNNDEESPLPGYILWPWSELEPVFKYCLENGVCNSKRVHLFHARTRWNLSLLTVAVINGAAEAVQFLITNGVDQAAYELGGFFPLLAAVSLQRIDVVEVLLNHSHETVNWWRKGYSFTPLLQAVTRNNVILVKMLLDAGANVSFLYSGLTIFGVAIKRQADRALKVLLEHIKQNKSHVVADCNTNSSPIQTALLTGNVEMFQIVLEWEIEGSVENLTPSSIERMKICFNEPRSNGNSIYALAKFTGNIKIIDFIHKCVERGEQVLGDRIELDTNVNLDKMVEYTISAVDIGNLVDNCDVF